MGAERALCPGLRQHGFRPGAAFAILLSLVDELS